MRKQLSLLILSLGLTPMVCTATDFVTFTKEANTFSLTATNDTIVYAPEEWEGVVMAVNNLRQDLKAVTGKAYAPITVATVGKSPLARNYPHYAQQLKGKWEQYLIVADPATRRLVILGSDKRGTIYGIYELSRQLGVSPWYWWADIPIATHNEVYIRHGQYTDGEPKVKYRGIFINDENPCMQQWARQKFGGMNSKMYERVYELLLRMKANLLWPGMWGTFKEYKPMVPVMQNPDGSLEGNCFNWDDTNNPRLADKMGIVVGTSHHEPMQRSQQEWVRTKQNYGNGEWNYLTNEEGLKRFFREGIEHTKDYECMITVGMRGDEDRPMADAGGREANMRLLKKIFNDQHRIINDVMGRKAKKTPLVWTLYSEMLDYYDDGFQVPDDVTVMLCDDNWGDIRKIPTSPTNGKGGFGMYYHFGYYGAPRAMKWLQQMQIQQTWQQMDLAYRSGIDRVWIVNVGDIKPAEFATQFFMDMAWNPTLFGPDNLMDYTETFCRSFAGSHAREAARILNLYNKYAARITAEMLNEKSYSLATGEWQQVRNEFMVLEAEALRLKEFISPEAEDAYREIVLFPVQALANLYDMYYSLAVNRHLALLGEPEANDYADRVEQCFERDSLLTYYYNKVMAQGKWDGIMTQVHIGYTTWHAPQYNTMPKVERVPHRNAPSNGKKESQGGYLFTEQGGEVVINAGHYYEAKAPEGMAWTLIPHLGKTASALELRGEGDCRQGSLAYRMQLPSRPSKVKVRLVFATVMPFIKGGHDVEMGFEGCNSVTRNLNKDMNWQHCYDLMYPAGAARVIEIEQELEARPLNGHTYQLRLRPLTPGLVLQRIIIDLGGHRPSMLHGNESPMTKR